MKLIKGHTLAELLGQRKNREVDHGRFLAIFEQICQALAFAHARSVIHRGRAGLRSGAGHPQAAGDRVSQPS
jgi:hypothetical protein